MKRLPAILAAFAGYTAIWYSWSALTGRVKPTAFMPSLFDLIVPGRFVAPVKQPDMKPPPSNVEKVADATSSNFKGLQGAFLNVPNPGAAVDNLIRGGK